MHTSAIYLLILASAALGGDPPGLPLTGVPLPPIRTQAPPADDSLPAPRPLPPAAPPREEPAPAPREIHNLAIPPLLSGQPREEPAPMPHPATPPPPRMLAPHPFNPAPMADIHALHQAIEGLRQEREAMLNEQADLAAARDAHSAGSSDAVRLRRRITELLAKAAARVIQRAAEPTAAAPEAKEKTHRQSPQNPQSSHSAPPTASAHAAPSPSLSPPPPKAGEKEGAAQRLTEAPVDPLTLAQALFQSGDSAAALAAYRKLEQEEQKPDDRITIQYMIACCLRKLGKADEASVMYREVANSGGSEVLVESAQWYLRALRERHELEAQLQQLRQRRQAITPRKS